MKYHKRKDGFRSGFEATVAADLTKRGVKFEYEAEKLEISVKVIRHFCRSCGENRISRWSTYLPDFKLGREWFIEAKGRFTARNRATVLSYINDYPKHRYYIIFQRDNTLSKGSKTRYSDWCKKNGVKYAIGTKVPQEWIK